MAPPLRQETLGELVRITMMLKGRASFRGILLEANKKGVVADHRTLRRYLDLLVSARVLQVRTRDVGSVNPQQLYTTIDSEAHLWTGLAALKSHGLSWDIPDNELYKVETDLEALTRAKPLITTLGTQLATGLEDTLVHEISRDATKRTGTLQLVTAILATRSVDLQYLLRRADTLKVGQAARLLVQKIEETFASLPGDTDGRVWLEARNRFVRILRDYNSRGLLQLVRRRGTGQLGLDFVKGLSRGQIVDAAGNQLGIKG